MVWTEIAPMLVMMTAILTVGGVAVLRPISRRLGELVQLMSQQKRDLASGEAERLREHVAALESRLALMEERQAFTEALLAESRRPGSLPNGAATGTGRLASPPESR